MELPDLSPRPTSALARDLQEIGPIQARVTGSFGCVFGKSQRRSQIVGEKKQIKKSASIPSEGQLGREWKEQGREGQTQGERCWLPRRGPRPNRGCRWALGHRERWPGCWHAALLLRARNRFGTSPEGLGDSKEPEQGPYFSLSTKGSHPPATLCNSQWKQKGARRLPFSCESLSPLASLPTCDIWRVGWELALSALAEGRAGA